MWRGGRCEHPSCVREVWQLLDRLVAKRRDGVVSGRVEDCRLGEERPLPLLPQRPLDDDNVVEPGRSEPGGAVGSADPLGQGLVVPVPRLPS